MELHERWLAELRSGSMKHKLALAEGKITNEEYMENVNKEVDLSTLSIQEVYALRSQAKKENNKPLLDKIYLFLNARSGGFVHTANQLEKTLDELQLSSNLNQHHGPTGYDRKYIEAGKLIQGDERVLVLIPHGTPEQSNAHSLQFWHLQDILTNAFFQEDPDSADIKDPSFVLMDPIPQERFSKDGLIQKEIEKADIVLELSVFGYWIVQKTPHVELDDDIRWILKLPEVTLNELFINNPKDVWVYIDHRQVDTNICENMYHAFANHMVELGRTDINLHLMSGHPSPEWLRDKDIVLMATPIGFFAKTARQTPHTQKLIPKKELFGYDDFQGYPSLTSHCRAEFSHEVKPLSSDNDPGQFYRSGFGNEPLLPHENPGQAYALSAQAEEARVQLELTEMSIKRFGYILADPETGLTVSKEEQDKHVQAIVDAANSRKK